MKAQNSLLKVFLPIIAVTVLAGSWFYKSQNQKEDPSPSLNSSTAFSSEQKKELEKLVLDIIRAHPTEIMESLNSAMQVQQDKFRQDIELEATKNRETLIQTGVLLGNEKADVHLAIFIDPLCPHCLELTKIVHALLAKRQDIAIHWIPVALLGPNSFAMSRLYMAAAKQSPKLMEAFASQFAEKFSNKQVTKEDLTRVKLLQMAKDVGLDTAKLEKDEMSDDLKKILESNAKLAEKIKIPGVPSVIGFFVKDKEAVFIPPLDVQGFENIIEQLKLDKKTALENAKKEMEKITKDIESKKNANES